MKNRISKKSENNGSVTSPSVFQAPFADVSKLADYEKDIKKGIENYSLFHFFPDFIWPAWITDGITADSLNIQPPLLLNRTRRHWTSVSTLLSSDRLLIDSSLMMVPAFSQWSLEPWIYSEGELIRPFSPGVKTDASLDCKSSIFSAQWSYKNISMQLEVCCARIKNDEAVINFSWKGKNKKNDAVILAVRPYDFDSIGSIYDISFNKTDNVVKVNGNEFLCFGDSPGFLLSGNGESGDLDFDDRDLLGNMSCEYGLASMAAGFPCKGGEGSVSCRILLQRGGTLGREVIDVSQAKEEYSKYISLRTDAGMKLKVPDKKFQKWFTSQKLVLSNPLIAGGKGTVNSQFAASDFQQIIVVKALIAAGYLEEASRIIKQNLKLLSVSGKNTSFNEIIRFCYIIIAFTEYYINTRDSVWLQDNYHIVKDGGDVILRFLKNISSMADLPTNGITHYMKETPQPFDLIVQGYCLDSMAYLARCMGLFGDEKIYEKEKARLVGMAADEVNSLLTGKTRNSFFMYNVYGAYPFPLKEFSGDLSLLLTETIEKYYGSMPLNIPSYGSDMLNSALVCSNLIIHGRENARDMVGQILNPGDKMLYLPDFVNAVSGEGCFGNGSSIPVGAACFLMLRNMIFAEHESHLDIFPVPQENWLKAGKEVHVEGAPSRFGKINFSVKSTSNEINFFFEDLPKFIPPEIRITMPFSFKVKEGDDFIIKKQIGNTVYINGWPSLLKMQRK